MLLRFIVVLVILSVNYAYVVKEQPGRHVKNDNENMSGFLNFFNTNAYNKFDEISDKVPNNIERNIDEPIPELEDVHVIKVNLLGKIGKSESYIKNETFIADIAEKIDALTKDLDKNWSDLNKAQGKFEKSIRDVLDNTLTKKINKMLEDLNQISHKTGNETPGFDVTCNRRRALQHPMLACKVFVASSRNDKHIQEIDDNKLNHVKLTKDSEGHLVNFEMLIAIKGPRDGIIQLSNSRHPITTNDYFVEIVIGGNGNTDNRIRTMPINFVEKKDKRENILSTTEFKQFYIQIKDGTLNVFMDANTDSTPILSYTNEAQMKIIKYYSFRAYKPEAQVTFLYDC